MKLAIAALAAASLFAVAGSADAASFNCNKAKTKTEHAICGNGKLSQMDSQMASLYKQALVVTCGSKNTLRAQQRAWLAGRNGCGGMIPCLKNAYQDRIQELMTEIDVSEGGSCQ